ncbi:hypothetical protein COLO4_04330 [Corchorus olitorius]|uniref:Uncharacterized protein n=1 Tax=Corchorus olitorius TaxID=93759 RepID=A0A1R3KUJ9_9ROSI|nr:hypothetical protein COLO4_04330 [Corchorus olitorius]
MVERGMEHMALFTWAPEDKNAVELKYGKRCAEWLKNAMHRCREKFTKARAEEAARLGEGAVINDDYIWVKIMGIHKRHCYGLGNLITEMAVFPTRSQSSQSTSTMDTD